MCWACSRCVNRAAALTCPQIICHNILRLSTVSSQPAQPGGGAGSGMAGQRQRTPTTRLSPIISALGNVAVRQKFEIKVLCIKSANVMYKAVWFGGRAAATWAKHGANTTDKQFPQGKQYRALGPETIVGVVCAQPASAATLSLLTVLSISAHWSAC